MTRETESERDLQTTDRYEPSERPLIAESHGRHTKRSGERAVERLLTIVRTRQLQQLNALACCRLPLLPIAAVNQSRHC